MKKFIYLRGLLKELDNASKAYRDIQKSMSDVNVFDFDAWESTQEQRNAELKAEQHARAALHNLDMYMFCVKDVTVLDFDKLSERESAVDKELTAIFHQNGGNVGKAEEAIKKCFGDAL